jgi:NAD(P)-dependent dehydrogenase (short-subunit alcohol dehydrogenase family)
MAQTILITGTSSGFGKAIAEMFLDKGWNVVATMRRPDTNVFATASDRLKILPLDVTAPESIEKAFVDTIAAFGAIDVLVNNAGIGLASAFEVTPQSIVDEIFQTNVFGVMTSCRAIIPHMRRQGHGAIINVTSSTGIAPMPFVAVYAASKCAAEGFTEALSYELDTFDIKVKLVEPGMAPTTSFGANTGKRNDGLVPPDYEAFAQSFYSKLGNYPTAHTTAAHVAEAVYAAATDGSDKLRYPAGPDAELVASLRWTTTDDNYMARMREMFKPDGRTPPVPA